MLYQLLRKLYFVLPFKKQVFDVIKMFYTPSTRISGYLKFNGAFTVKVNEAQIRFHNDNSTIASLIYWKGLNGYESATLKVWAALSKNSKIILDVGANFGLFGILSKGLNPEATLYFFEPLNRNITRIERNLALNNFKSTVIKAAVSDSVGTAEFFDISSSENTIGSLSKSHVQMHQHHTGIKSVITNVITLDSFSESEKLKSIDLVKIDVEGFEIEVLNGFVQSIKKFRPLIIVEITNEENGIEVYNIMKTEKYCFYIIDDIKGLIQVNQINRDSSSKYYNFLLCPVEKTNLV
jgi:FkbM family methyltransferase